VATTSSDEAIGHVFAFSVLAEIVDDPWIKAKSIELLDALMSHIIRNDMYLIDYDGKPTLWGKWHPDYVNGFPEQVGDRKLNSSNIIAMLQTAFHFTGKEIYKEKAYELMEKHGYLENLMRPMAIIGQASDGSDDWSKMLSESWNHSDDEMYFLGYWGLYRYAFTPELKVQFKKSILDHWEAERPEKEALWNIFTALVQPENFDLKESIWFLEKHPIDLIGWQTQNSHRQDITTIPDNFRRQSTETVLSPSETRIMKHNGNRFTLDGGSQGTTVYSAGDIWLLPYWMGKYLQVIR
jgi:hemin uptake protein HemP